MNGICYLISFLLLNAFSKDERLGDNFYNKVFSIGDNGRAYKIAIRFLAMKILMKYYFSFLCLLSWSLKFPKVVKDFLQSGQLKGFSPVCKRK